MPNTPSRVATLSFNGTDTYYQPTGYIPDYPIKSSVPKRNRGETISFLAACIDRTTPDYEVDFRQCPALQTTTLRAQTGPGPIRDLTPPLRAKLIEGADTFGTLVYSKIAEGTTSLLGSILEGRTTLNIQGHSRGAVQSILVSHELDRIKKIFCDSTSDALEASELFKLLCDSPDANIKSELTRNLQPIKDNADFITRLKASFRAHDIRVNLCLLDPVPGNAVLGIPKIGWYDERYFKLPSIVENAKITICENEDSACFDCVIPVAENASATKVSVHKLLGHHGTLTGNPFGNRGESLESIGVTTGHAESAQIIALYENYNFLAENGTAFMLMKQDYPLADIYNAYHQATKIERKRLLLAAYDEMKLNEHVYKAMNNTVYIDLFGYPFHEAFTYPYEKTVKTRPVLQDIHNTKSSLDVRLPFKSERFVNEIHVQLFLEHTVGLDFDSGKRRFEQLSDLLTHLRMEENRVKLNRGLSDMSTRKQAEESIQSLVSELVQLYLQNNLTADEKAGILIAINQALNITIDSSHAHIEEKSDTPSEASSLDLLVHSLKENLNTHLIDQIERQVKTHYDDLATLVLSMRTKPFGETRPTTFIDNALAKYKQFKLFEEHLFDLMNNLPRQMQLTKDIPEKIARLKIYSDATVYFCAKTMHEKGISAGELPDEISHVNDFFRQTQTIIDGLSGATPELEYSLQASQQYAERLKSECLEIIKKVERHERNLELKEIRINELTQANASQHALLEEQARRHEDVINELTASINSSKLLGLEGISLQVISGFITVLGAATVALAFAALAVGAIATLPASAGVVCGAALMSLGMFGISKGARGQAYQEAYILNQP